KIANILKENNQTFGIYTSRANWIKVTGNTTKFSDAPLFYYQSDVNLQEDCKKNFDDFHQNPFGGWKEPTMKRYGCKSTCGSTYTLCSVWKP
uniref:Peptidase M12A domain-containing protein n=1 Tax=Meloidogyne hapla TaxID=6305 RepID=A0A1I8B3H0_MELHA